MKVGGEFKIIKADDQTTLEWNVKEYLNCGWELAGSMSVVHDPTVRFFQPMTKTKEVNVVVVMIFVISILTVLAYV